MWRLRQLIRNLRRLWYWLPVLWRDRDYDHSYMLIVLRHKFVSMERYFRKSGIMADAEQTADQIHLAVLLLDRLIDAWEYWERADRRAEILGDTTHNGLHDAMEQQHKHDAAVLFDHIRRHYRGWWD